MLLLSDKIRASVLIWRWLLAQDNPVKFYKTVDTCNNIARTFGLPEQTKLHYFRQFFLPLLEQGNAEIILLEGGKECEFVAGANQIFFEHENGLFNYYFINFRVSSFANISHMTLGHTLPEVSAPIFAMRTKDNLTEAFFQIYPGIVHKINASDFLRGIPSCNKWLSFLREENTPPGGEMQFWQGGKRWSNSEIDHNGLYKLGKENYGRRYYVHDDIVYRLPLYRWNPCIHSWIKLLHMIQRNYDVQKIFHYNPASTLMHWKSSGALPMILARAFHLADLKNHEMHYEHKYYLSATHYKKLKRIIYH